MQTSPVGLQLYGYPLSGNGLTIGFLITLLVFSGNWRSRSRIGSAVESSSTDECVEPDSFGFVDETGKEHIAKITEANRKAIYGALEKGDVTALKTEAGVAA